MIHHLLKLVTGGQTATVGINGAPILIDPTGAGLNATMPANPWLKPKENSLSIYLTMPPATNARLPEVFVRAQVFSVKADSPEGDPDTFLANFERNAGDPSPLPVIREIAFVVSNPPPSRLWSEAEKVSELSPADKLQLTTLIQKFAEAIGTRNLDAISALLAYKTRDSALSNGQDPDRMRQVIRDQYANRMFTETSLQIEGDQGNELEFKLIAGGQVVWLFRSLSKPALVVHSANKRFTLPVMAAKIGGSWKIVR